MASAFGGQRSIQLSYGCVALSATSQRALSKAAQASPAKIAADLQPHKSGRRRLTLVIWQGPTLSLANHGADHDHKP